MNNNILLIEDNECILETLALRIGARLQGWNILTAKNGYEGTEIMSYRPVSLVLTDLQMPGMDGYGVIEFRNRNFPLIPLFVMTGNLSSSVRDKLRELHVSACFEKPFDFDTLFHHVASSIDTATVADAMFADTGFYTQQRRVA